jgi:hypothetical protein
MNDSEGNVRRIQLRLGGKLKELHNRDSKRLNFRRDSRLAAAEASPLEISARTAMDE